MTKAYSTLQIKSVTDTDDERIITGIATTPSTDRDDDILEPTGAKFALPIPLLWQHSHNQPIGEVTHATVTDQGIEIAAKIAKIDEDGRLKQRIERRGSPSSQGLLSACQLVLKSMNIIIWKALGGYTSKNGNGMNYRSLPFPPMLMQLSQTSSKLKMHLACTCNPPQNHQLTQSSHHQPKPPPKKATRPMAVLL